jgi:Zn-dependent M32 family carboxypeptidase
VHRQGMRWAPAVLVERATGEAPDPAYLVDSLERRYRVS